MECALERSVGQAAGDRVGVKALRALEAAQRCGGAGAKVTVVDEGPSPGLIQAALEGADEGALGALGGEEEAARFSA